MNAQEPAGLDRVVESIEQQIGWCRDFASPFTAMVLELIRDNLVRGGALVALVVPWPGEPMRDVLALRLAGGLQMMARTGLAPRLVPFYPAGSANPDRAGFAREIEAAVAANAAYVRDFISRPPQTNEIGRSAALMPAYAGIARRTGLPLRILEVGASAGLNMMWDRFRYRLGEHELGEARRASEGASIQSGTLGATLGKPPDALPAAQAPGGPPEPDEVVAGQVHPRMLGERPEQPNLRRGERTAPARA